MTTELALEIAAVAVCLFLGGVLKGATGAGAPVLAIPALTVFFDVRFAIVVMVVPNLITNVWQALKFRRDLPERSFVLPLVAAGVVGILTGTWLLTQVPLELLPAFVAAAVIGYIALRLLRPDWVLPMAAAKALAAPAGLAAGLLQGAAGLSAPISITFLNAMRLPRLVFIATISLLFVAFTAFQLAALWFGGIAAPRELMISAVALGPIVAGMPVGAAVARRLGHEVFDRAILALLALIALRLLVGLFQ